MYVRHGPSEMKHGAQSDDSKQYLCLVGPVRFEVDKHGCHRKAPGGMTLENEMQKLVDSFSYDPNEEIKRAKGGKRLHRKLRTNRILNRVVSLVSSSLAMFSQIWSE
jgi:hypothetical protein